MSPIAATMSPSSEFAYPTSSASPEACIPPSSKNEFKSEPGFEWVSGLSDPCTWNDRGVSMKTDDDPLVLDVDCVPWFMDAPRLPPMLWPADPADPSAYEGPAGVRHQHLVHPTPAPPGLSFRPHRPQDFCRYDLGAYAAEPAPQSQCTDLLPRRADRPFRDFGGPAPCAYPPARDRLAPGHELPETYARYPYDDGYAFPQVYPQHGSRDPAYATSLVPDPFLIPDSARAAPAGAHSRSGSYAAHARHGAPGPYVGYCQWRTDAGYACHAVLDDPSAAGIARHLKDAHFPGSAWEKTARGPCRWGGCERPVMDYASFGKHIASVHLREANAWACDWCGRDFGRRDAMRRHTKTCPKAPEDKKDPGKATARPHVH